MIKCLTLRQFICPLSLFLKEIPFASLTNAIDVKIERVLTGFLIGLSNLFQRKQYAWPLTCKASCLKQIELRPLISGFDFALLEVRNMCVVSRL
jgi:hypothetical protein